MGGERKKVQIQIGGLPEPWMAYVHIAKKRVFYHNPNTNSSVWELPPKAKKKCKPGLEGILEIELGKILSSKDADSSLEMMDCTEWEEPASSPKDDCEAMDIDLTQDLRQMRGSHYDQEALPLHTESQQPFEAFPGTSRSCVVFDTCALIDDPDLISECISRHVSVVIPYRVYYELDRMKKLTSETESAAALGGSFSPVEGFMTSSEEDVNDDYILKCAFRIKALLDARNAGWEVVFITNDQLLSLKAHASKIPCYNVEETNAILAKAPVIGDEAQQDAHSASENKVSSSAPSSSENTGRENQREVGRKEKGIAKNGLPKLDNAIKAHKLKTEGNRYRLREREKPDDNVTGPTGPLETFDKMWRPLLGALHKSFTTNQDEASLAQMVKMVWWLYYYYFPQQDDKEVNYQVIIQGGLLKELRTPSARSKSVMHSLRKFSNDSKFAHE
ncbi:WW domain protein [Oesophagostomum dentatum]|uniref:WW domain protein n=1 Tax=Oesophagostomum dentatum TaxID=61180 RepID=A0A0B1TU84_OESDE|nr:WW domain protein [Oesophagostomum dentatum]